MNIISKIIILLSLTSFSLHAEEATCYALTDNSNKLYKVTMKPNSSSLPIATTIDISHSFNAEGSAYLAKNNTFYAFSGVSDDMGPSNLYKINVDTGEITLLKTLLIPTTNGTVEGAEFYFNPTLNREILYVISQENNSKLYAFDPDNNWELLNGYPKNTNTDLSSLAIDPKTGKGYAIDDYNYDNQKPKVYELNLETGATTYITTLQHLADAEGLAFASDGNLYVEDEGRDDLDGKKLYMVNLTTGALTPAAITNANGDIEGLSCNGTAMNISNDFGDAPNEYTHVSHKISENLYLGNKKPDAENDQQSSADASGDGDDDNDGVVTLPTLTIGDKLYTVPVKVFNNTGNTAYITAWIDFNRDGIFQYEEALNTNNLEIASASEPQTVNVQWSNDFENQLTDLTVGKAIMRIRLTTSRILRCDDPHYKENGDYADNYLVSPDGEVEDYVISIENKILATEPFTCNNEGIIFSADSTTATFTNFSKVNLETGTYNFIQEFATRHINAAGYNVQDNFIYGVGFTNDNHDTIDIVKVDSNYSVEKLNITGLPQGNSLYALGDVDFNNKLYVSTIQSENSESYDYLKSLIVINLETQTVERETDLIFPNNMTEIVSADYAFNPKDEMLYTVDYKDNELIRINPITGEVKRLGNVGDINNVYSVISFFDLDGNFFFTNNDNTTIYKIDISDPSNVNPIATTYITGLDMPSSGDGAKCAYSKVPKKEFFGTFNVERTNSANFDIMSSERNAWYTQIAGRDFDYSVLFYNEELNSEQNISAMTIKIELIDQDTNRTLYERYAYIPEDAPTSRIDVTLPTEDLATLPATRKAIFRVSYGVDENNSIIQQACLDDYKSCYEKSILKNVKTDYAKDNFSIRPENYYVRISDNNNKIVSSQDANRSINLAAGYDYNLTFTATSYNSNGDITPAQGYTKGVSKTFDFISSGTCHSTNPINLNLTFNDGEFNINTFSHNNVGKYILDINDSTWTNIDQNETQLGCLKNSNLNIANAEGKVGCNIAIYIKPIEVNFEPHHFNINLTMQNLPNSGHPNFIYMMELNASNDNVAIQFDGNITAKSKNNVTTTNFTAGCVAKNILLDLNTTTISVEGVNQRIFTTDNITPVDFSRVIRFNGETNTTNFDVNNTLTNIGNKITIDSSRFLNENNGTMSLDMRYNLNKNLTQPINPVQVTFNSIDVSSPDANSSAYLISNYMPKKKKNFLNNIKNFYFARVVSNLNDYPRVNMHISPLVRTPLNVDIYCGTAIPNYCKDRKVMDNSIVSGTVREQNGYYLSSKHNGELDGNVTELLATPNIVTISPNPNKNIALNKGTNGKVNEVFNNCSSPTSTIKIKTHPVLAFTPSEYTVNCTKADPSQWAGIGKTGNILEVRPNIEKSGKMDW